jgi:MATE family multidrug resistance protein
VTTPASYTPPTLRDLAALAWPMVLARASQSVLGFADAALVAPLGNDALAATSNGSLNALAVFMLPIGVVALVQSFSAQLHARGDAARARRYAVYGLGVAAITELVALLAIPLIPAALGYLDYSPAVRALMASFLAWRLLGAGFAVGVEALTAWFGGQGNTRIGLVASVSVMGVNVPLAALLIRGAGPVPAMGVRGAALANTLATAVGFAVLVWAWRRETRETPRTPPRGEEFLRLLRVGLPNGVNWFLEFGAFMFFIDVVFARLGTQALAALMAVLQLNTVAFMPAFGVASANAIHVGGALGAGAPGAVPRMVLRAAMVTAVWMLCVGAVYALLPAALLRLFSDGGAGAEGFVSVGAALLLVSVAWQLFDAASMVIAEALRAAGDTAWPMAARIAISWGLFVPITLFAVRRGAGPVDALAWVVAYMALLTALLFARFRAGAWRRMDLAGAEPTVD